ncbi:MAG: hypothetical protein HRT44_06195, partial [Bdellovibrionales bacterium]|nr:hypothetical protein [Bdellovibrionales bacterium]NQZ18832.1 hypothetical protein [Bdellovibrionales bacterium]
VKAITLSNGKRLHAARWSNGIGPSMTVILKPNFTTGDVQEVCRIRNKTQKVEVRELRSKGELVVFYRSEHNTADYSNRVDEFDHNVGWKKCAKLSDL